MKPTLKDIIDYNTKVGTSGTFIDGIPGSGKTQMSLTLGSFGLNRGYCIVMRGDNNCEWRHFINVPERDLIKIIILLPKEIKGLIHYEDFPKKVLEGNEERIEFRYVNFNKLNINDHIKKKHIIVIYDECFPNYSQRCWLITDQLGYLIRRYKNKSSKMTIMYIENEAGRIYPMNATSQKSLSVSNQHWLGVNTAANHFVEFRKKRIMGIYIAQLAREFTDIIRDKCPIHVLRKGKASSMSPRSVKKSVPWQSIQQYTIIIAGAIYRKDLEIAKFPETKKEWLMIPKEYINYECLLEKTMPKKDKKRFKEQRDKLIRLVVNSGYTQERVAYEIGVKRQYIGQICNNI